MSQPSAGSFLGRMASASRTRVKAARARESEGALVQRAMATAPPATLSLGDFDIIAELKFRSPAAGVLATEDFDRDAQLGAYATGGAAAISILTEPTEFNGSMEDLSAAARLLAGHGIPAMRKDFLTEPYQVLEARAAGAGGVLIIVTMLGDSEVEALLQCAAECSLFVLLEGFDERDLQRVGALDVGEMNVPILCGVNCRDLTNLKVDFDRFRELAAYLPPGLPAVAESGISNGNDIVQVAQLGYRVALVGSALMGSAQKGLALAGSKDTAAEVASLRRAGIDQVRATRCS